ncbi:glutathione S-transferase family protein [Tropicimonas sp. IMCC6043]|nr:glutathione S-transferase family protein [Tropicimonas sp. IMCC6043]
MIELWGRATSSNVQAVRWALLELGLDHRRHDVGEGFGGLDTPEFLAMNPVGKIPVIRDGALTLFESAAILRYLASNYGDQGFWPAGAAARATTDQWAEWAKQEIANRFTGPVFWRVVRTPAARRDAAAIAEALDIFETQLAIAEARLARHPWLVGDHMTPGDILLGHVLYRYFDIDIARRPLPALRGYYDRLTARPAYRDAVMISYDSLRDTK